MIRETIQKLVEGINLTAEESRQTLTEIMTGTTTNAQTAAFLAALRMKGETVDELTSFVKVMRDNCCQITPNVKGRLVDTCGTGGDRLKTFNISTAAAFVVAGAGVAVAKHGNRSVTSKSGSADVLEKLGVNLNVEPKEVEKIIEQVGVGFMFAPAFHPAMKYAVAVRKEIGIRTVFNVLGPLTNPARANAQLLGVYGAKLTLPLAYALKNLGCEEAMVVHGSDGLDEISTLGKTEIAWLREGEVATLETTPSDFGVEQAGTDALQGDTPEENAQVLLRILTGCLLGADEAKKDIVLVNAAAGIIVGGAAEDFAYGIEVARKSVESGAAYQKLRALVKSSGGNMARLEELEKKNG